MWNIYCRTGLVDWETVGGTNLPGPVGDGETVLVYVRCDGETLVYRTNHRHHHHLPRRSLTPGF